VSDNFGGGIASTQGPATLVDSIVSDNSGGGGGAGIFSAYGATLSLTRTSVTGNSSPYDGGGIYANDSAVTITSSPVSGNTAAYNGGGLVARFSTVTITDSTVGGNTATGSGGGIFNVDSSSVTLGGATRIEWNHAVLGGGGGIWSSGSPVTASPGWTGTVANNTPDNCEPTMVLGGTTCS
jgi:predicted outer membrane repeat protein